MRYLSSGESILGYVNIFLTRAEECGRAIVAECDRLHLVELYIYGSCARGTADMCSDIDFFMIIDGTTEEAVEAQDYVTYDMFNIMERDFPFADVHACSLYRWNSVGEHDTEFEDFLQNIRNEGVCIWHR